ncbi:hypothetical protein ES703_112563 [subsurface metagenome]
MSHRCADTVGAGVSPAYNDNLLVFRVDVATILEIAIEQTSSIRSQKIHREMNAIQFSAGNRQISWNGRSGRKQ